MDYRVILGLHRDNGKDKGLGFRVGKVLETTIF